MLGVATLSMVFSFDKFFNFFLFNFMFSILLNKAEIGFFMLGGKKVRNKFLLRVKNYKNSLFKRLSTIEKPALLSSVKWFVIHDRSVFVIIKNDQV